MGDAVSPMRIHDLQRGLAVVGWKRRLWEWLARLAQGLWLWGLMVLLVVLIDARWPMPAMVRGVIGLGLIVAAAGLLWRARLRREDAERGLLGDARRIEMHHELSSNELLTGLMLTPVGETAGDGLARGLARRAVDRGIDTMGRVDCEVVVDRRAARGHLAGVLAVAMAWGVTLLLMPTLIPIGLNRLADPAGQTPPFSLTRIEVRAENEQASTGGDVRVVAEMSGRVPDEAELVELNEAGEEVRRWAMQPSGDQRFEFTLRSLRQPMMVRIEAGDGQSRPIRVEAGGRGESQAGPGLAAMSGRSSTQTEDVRPGRGEGSGVGQASGPTDGSDSGTMSAVPGTSGQGDGSGDAVRGGVYEEAAATIQGGRGIPEAVMQQAPPEYRPLIRRYFDRLATDQQQESSP